MILSVAFYVIERGGQKEREVKEIKLKLVLEHVCMLMIITE